MSQRRRRARPLLSLLLLLMAPAIVSAQSVAANGGSSKLPIESERGSAGAVSETSDANVNERLRALEEELRQQNKTLTEMRALIADQQRLITALAGKATSGEPKAGEPKDVATTATVTTPQDKAPTLEDRVKKVENKVLAIGPFRLSGDFRLRF